MDTLHTETLDFLVHVLKTKHQQMRGEKSAAEGKRRKAEVEHLRRRITLEFYYQTQGKGDSPK